MSGLPSWKKIPVKFSWVVTLIIVHCIYKWKSYILIILPFKFGVTIIILSSDLDKKDNKVSFFGLLTGVFYLWNIIEKILDSFDYFSMWHPEQNLGFCVLSKEINQDIREKNVQRSRKKFSEVGEKHLEKKWPGNLQRWSFLFQRSAVYLLALFFSSDLKRKLFKNRAIIFKYNINWYPLLCYRIPNWLFFSWITVQTIVKKRKS